jgi:hypothetical protein
MSTIASLLSVKIPEAGSANNPCGWGDLDCYNLCRDPK